MKYPISKNIPDMVRTKTGKKIDEINIENIMNGRITSEDIKISKETLLIQADIAKENGRVQLKRNFIRASELVEVPDDVILKIYNLLRPYRATKEELISIAFELRDKYNAENCSKFILEAARVYEKRGILKS